MESNSPYDVYALREEFPIFKQRINGEPLAYLDSASSAAKPQAVIKAMSDFFANDYANVHRGLHTLSMRSTDLFESARRKVAEFIGATEQEIIFTRNATEGINLVASSFARRHLKAGQSILISAMEHHANIVPWQILAKEMEVALKIIPIDERGVLDMSAYETTLANDNIGLVCVVHVSNVLGTVNPVAQMIELAHVHGIPVMVDACQSVVHMPLNVKELDADFLVFSSHKLYGPTGLGVLYGKTEFLQDMPPYQAGGEMIKEVSYDKVSFADPPLRFEAGTPAITEAIGLMAAIEWIEKWGLDCIHAHEVGILEYAQQQAYEFQGMRIIGNAPNKVSVLSFHFDTMHAHDISTILDQGGVAVRAGHHCAQPLMQHFGVTATARASFAAYSTYEEVDQLFAALRQAKALLS